MRGNKNTVIAVLGTLVVVLVGFVIFYKVNTPKKTKETVKEQISTLEAKDDELVKKEEKMINLLAGENDTVVVDHDKKDFELTISNEELTVNNVKDINLDIVSDEFRSVWRDLRGAYEFQSIIIDTNFPGYSLTVKDREGEVIGVFKDNKTIYEAFVSYK